MLLVVFADLVVEKVLLVLERFRAPHVLEHKLRESGRYYVPLFRY